VRKATDEDLLPLTTQFVIGRVDSIQFPTGKVAIPHGFNPANPLNNNEVLDKDEAAAAASRITELNTRIAAVATAYGLAYWDANSFLVKVKPGVYFEGIKFSGAFISGNAFSLDGVHLTPMGYALVANQMIATINGKYGCRIPGVSLTHYRSVKFPS
jgi:lysophospholipase L1-like esterase